MRLKRAADHPESPTPPSSPTKKRACLTVSLSPSSQRRLFVTEPIKTLDNHPPLNPNTFNKPAENEQVYPEPDIPPPLVDDWSDNEDEADHSDNDESDGPKLSGFSEAKGAISEVA